RISIAFTRAIIKSILEGTLKNADYWKDDIFGLDIPGECPGVPADILNPASGWTDKDKYATGARKLAEMFENVYLDFKKDDKTEKEMDLT
ncbi:MAG: phosphoenolpyruvate carboxykinase (ATP), partial [Candidatus Zixiibacteriota bacterium]